jgi:hypothetical protein
MSASNSNYSLAATSSISVLKFALLGLSSMLTCVLVVACLGRFLAWQVEMGEIDWIPDGRCATLETAEGEDGEVEAAVKLLQEQVRPMPLTPCHVPAARITTFRLLTRMCDIRDARAGEHVASDARQRG